MAITIRGGVVCQDVREREYYLGKMTTASAVCVCVCSTWGEGHRASCSKARVNSQYPSHFSVPFQTRGAGEAGGRVKRETGADTDTDTGNPSAVKHHHSRHPAFQMETLAGDRSHRIKGDIHTAIKPQPVYVFSSFALCHLAL